MKFSNLFKKPKRKLIDTDDKIEMEELFLDPTLTAREIHEMYPQYAYNTIQVTRSKARKKARSIDKQEDFYSTLTKKTEEMQALQQFAKFFSPPSRGSEHDLAWIPDALGEVNALLANPGLKAMIQTRMNKPKEEPTMHQEVEINKEELIQANITEFLTLPESFRTMQMIKTNLANQKPEDTAHLKLIYETKEDLIKFLDGVGTEYTSEDADFLLSLIHPEPEEDVKITEGKTLLDQEVEVQPKEGEK